MLAYLVEEDGLIETRNREVKIRPLDKEKIREDKMFWQILNVGAPWVMLISFGTIFHYWRKRKYTRF
jgi:hypothetical protein